LSLSVSCTGKIFTGTSLRIGVGVGDGAWITKGAGVAGATVGPFEGRVRMEPKAAQARMPSMTAPRREVQMRWAVAAGTGDEPSPMPRRAPSGFEVPHPIQRIRPILTPVIIPPEAGPVNSVMVLVSDLTLARGHKRKPEPPREAPADMQRVRLRSGRATWTRAQAQPRKRTASATRLTATR